MKESKGFSGSIGGGGGSAPVNSKSLLEADGRFDKSRAQADRGAGSITGGAYGAPNGLLKAGKPAVVTGPGPSPARSVRQSKR